MKLIKNKKNVITALLVTVSVTVSSSFASPVSSLSGDAKEISQISSEAQDFVEKVKLSDSGVLKVVRSNIDVYIRRAEIFLNTINQSSLAQAKKKMTLLKQVQESKQSVVRQKDYMSPVMESVMMSQLEKIEKDITEGNNESAKKRVYRTQLILKGIKKLI